LALALPNFNRLLKNFTAGRNIKFAALVVEYSHRTLIMLLHALGSKNVLQVTKNTT